MSTRSVARIVTTQRTLEGAGFAVRRPFPTLSIDHFDPFLLLDHMGPSDYAPGEAVGAPDHPHRGFETVTYMLDGAFEHRDSQGNAGRLTPGDVQWMTAGSGIVHSEMPAASILRDGGRIQGFQLWVNLPRRDKMTRPRYQEISAAHLPLAQSEDGKVSVRVIAGESMGHQAVIETHTPIAFLHFTVQPGASFQQPIGREYNTFVYVVNGKARFGADGTEAGEGQAVLFGADGESITLSVPADSTEPASILLLAGVPLNEPVARYGPFVMNTRDEIIQAIEDYRLGRMGSIPAEVARV
ncbi:MAG: pirin family protein [Chloroflexi bacterium]|nr:pirin family protein [Chloroflexota bacterium]